MWHSVGAREAQGKQTGPKTDEGKARAAAASSGPVTPQGKFKSSANGFLHGAHARRHLIPPAKPGEYPECETCPVMEECKEMVEERRGTSVFVPCTTILNIQEKFLHAAINGNPEKLKEFQGVAAAKAARIIQSGLEMILADNLMKKKVTRYGKDTEVEEFIAHPLLKPISEMMKQQGWSLADWMMTPASQEEGGQIRGFLGSLPDGELKMIVGEFNKKLTDFPKALKKGAEDAAADPVAQAYHAEREAEETAP